MTKDELRKQIKEEIKKLSAAERDTQSLYVCLQVIGSDKQLADFGHVMAAMSAESAQQQSPEEMTLRRVVLLDNSPFVGKTIKESGIRDQYQCLVVGVESEGENELLQPHPMRQLQTGDIIWVVGEEANIKQLEA